MAPALTVRVERWPIAGTFTISRGAKTEAVVVVAELTDGQVRGRGECVPYARYGETVEGISAAIEAMRDAIARGLDRQGLQSAMPPGAARNALDCALFDLEAKRRGQPAYALAGLPPPQPLVTAFTISLASPEMMAEAAAQARKLSARSSAVQPTLASTISSAEGAARRTAASRAGSPGAPSLILSRAREPAVAAASAMDSGGPSEIV